MGCGSSRNRKTNPRTYLRGELVLVSLGSRISREKRAGVSAAGKWLGRAWRNAGGRGDYVSAEESY